MGLSNNDAEPLDNGSEPDEPAPTRRVVLHPRTASARRADRVRTSGMRVRGYVADPTEVLDYLAEQRRLALRFFLPIVAAIVATLVATMFIDGLRTATWGRTPIIWLVIGPVTLFTLLVVAAVAERRALRVESKWMDTHS